MTPRATYRIQFHKDFQFADAEALVPYLAELGISHLYASPVLAARAGATPEILADAGRYYEAQDVEGCARQIGAILEDVGLRGRLRTQGLERAKDFSYEGEVDRLIEIFHRVGDQRLP